MQNLNTGGGYINPLQRLKARAIKTPLKFYRLFNDCINKCKTIEELYDFLESHDKNKLKEIKTFLKKLDK